MSRLRVALLLGLGIAAPCAGGVASALPRYYLHSAEEPPPAEPEPGGRELVQLGPVPAEEPAPAGEREVEPEPGGRELVQLGPAPEEEPRPAGEDELDRDDEDLSAPRSPALRAERRRWRAEARRASREPGVCGAGGGPIAAFSVDGHRFSPGWLDRTLHGVIANRCQSKTYRDVLSLDGGTVGICHFASGSLLTLYQHMDARRYFGAHAGRVPDRPYALPWWREGMHRFLRSPESQRAQQLAWRAYISPALQSALRHGWRTDRELAIAASVANSLGAYGFQQISQQNRWEPERTLRSYATLSDHKERRRQRLDREFPVGAPNS